MYSPLLRQLPRTNIKYMVAGTVVVIYDEEPLAPAFEAR